MSYGSRSEIVCDFCGRTRNDVGPMAEGPAPIHICGPCSVQALRIVKAERDRQVGGASDGTAAVRPHDADVASLLHGHLTCSFCGKPGAVVEGPNDVYMCLTCVDRAGEIARDVRRRFGN